MCIYFGKPQNKLFNFRGTDKLMILIFLIYTFSWVNNVKVSCEFIQSEQVFLKMTLNDPSHILHYEVFNIFPYVSLF